MTLAELAAEIGMSHRVLRGWLRRQYPRRDDEHYARWDLGPHQVAAVRIHEGKVGWPTGLEPVTFGATIRCSAIELRPPRDARAWRSHRLAGERTGV